MINYTQWTHVVSFPKSGKTWTKFMMGHILVQHAGLPLTEVLDRIGHQRQDPAKILDGRPIPYFHHGEHAVCQTARVTQASLARRPVYLLLRDPRDVVVSHYLNQSFGFKRFEGSLSEFIRFASDRADPTTPAARFGIVAIINFMNAYIESAERFSTFRVGFYEDFRADPRAELDALCRFLNVPATPAQLDAAVEFASFDNMRRLEDQGGYERFGLQGSDREDGRKVRCGKIGGHADYLTPDDSAFIEEAIRTRLHPSLARYTPASVG